jgi:hypothetical protein
MYIKWNDKRVGMIISCRAHRSAISTSPLTVAVLFPSGLARESDERPIILISNPPRYGVGACKSKQLCNVSYIYNEQIAQTRSERAVQIEFGAPWHNKIVIPGIKWCAH